MRRPTIYKLFRQLLPETASRFTKHDAKPSQP